VGADHTRLTQHTRRVDRTLTQLSSDLDDLSQLTREVAGWCGERVLTGSGACGDPIIVDDEEGIDWDTELSE